MRFNYTHNVRSLQALQFSVVKRKQIFFFIFPTAQHENFFGGLENQVFSFIGSSCRRHKSLLKWFVYLTVISCLGEMTNSIVGQSSCCATF